MKYERTCLWCRASIIGRRPNVKYCTQQHKRNARKSRRRGTAEKKAARRPCPVCQSPIPVSRRVGTLFCSDKCGNTYSHRGDPFYYLVFQPRTCKDCGMGFETLFPTQERCGACQHTAVRNHHTHSRRCKKYGVPFQSFSILKIFHQDNWTCWICNLPAPKELRGSVDPSAPELDHVIPLHMGPGKSPGHVPSNCRCAHRKCNQERNL